LQHADAVVIGEAEEVWPRLLSDVASREMQKLYCANKISDLSQIPIPRRDLYPKPRHKGYTLWRLELRQLAGARMIANSVQLVPSWAVNIGPGQSKM